MNPRRGAVLLLLAILLGRFLAPAPPRGGRQVTEAEALRLVPGGAAAPLVESPVPHREVRGSGAAAPLLGRVASSSVVVPVEGYGGPLDVLVATDADGRVTAVEVRRHQETPSYVAGLFDPPGLAALRGATVASPLLPGEDVDARSGATVSQGALLSAVRGTLRGLAGGTAGLPGTGGLPGTADLPGTAGLPGTADLPGTAGLPGTADLPGTAGLPGTGTVVRVAFVLLALGLGWWSWRRGQSAVRCLALVAGAAAGGLGVFLSMEGLYPPLLDGRCRAGPAWIVLALGTLALALLRGRVFCGTVCPFGALQEMVGVVAGRSGPDGLAPSWRSLRYVAAASLVVLAGATAARASFLVDPIFLCLTQDASTGALALWLGALAASLVATRLWCRVLCPVGALLSAVGCAAPSPVVVTSSCVRCGACSMACPMGCLSVPDAVAGEPATVPGPVALDASACILCGACRRACPRVALAPSRPYPFHGAKEGDLHASER